MFLDWRDSKDPDLQHDTTDVSAFLILPADFCGAHSGYPYEQDYYSVQGFLDPSKPQILSEEGVTRFRRALKCLKLRPQIYGPSNDEGIASRGSLAGYKKKARKGH